MKFITKKVIQGKGYYYLQYEGFSKNIGTFLPKDLKSKMVTFFQEVGRKKYDALPERIKKEFPYGNLQRLEEERYEHIVQSQSELFARERHDFFFWFTIWFSYNSNRAEGSKVTRPEMEQFAFSKIRKPKTKTEREIYNSFQALHYALSDQMKWNMKQIKHIHKLLLEELDPLIAGKWKTQNNTAPGNQPTTDYKQVQKKMKALMAWLKSEFKKKSYPPLLAVQFYCRFERIHPFLDGNGRMGRILLNAILYKFKYMPVIFFTRNHQEHCAGIAKALSGYYKKINKHFLSQAQKTYQELAKIVSKR